MCHFQEVQNGMWKWKKCSCNCGKSNSAPDIMLAHGKMVGDRREKLMSEVQLFISNEATIDDLSAMGAWIESRLIEDQVRPLSI